MVLNQLFNTTMNLLNRTSEKRNYSYDAYLVGYYGMQNSGDDALLLASIIGAKNELNAEKILVSTVNCKQPLSQGITLNVLKAKQAFKGQNRVLHYKAAYKSRRVIFGGGSVFHTAQDIEQKRHMMMLTGGRNSMAVGVSLGPFVDSAAKEQCKLFLEECSFVGVRDKESLILARELAPNANVALTFDLAPLVTLDPDYSRQTKPENRILINVCPVPKNANGKVDQYQQHSLMQKMQQVIEMVWQKSHLPITLVSLNGHDSLGDDKLCHQLMESCPKNIPINFLPYQADPLKMIEQIRGYRAFVSMRLHGCVFGYLANTPVLALNYHTKCQQWCEQVGLAHEQRFNALTFHPKQIVETLLEGLRFGFSSPALAVNDAVKLSLRNWRVQQ